MESSTSSTYISIIDIHTAVLFIEEVADGFAHAFACGADRLVYAVRPYVVNSLILVVVDAFVPTMAEMPHYIVALSSVVSKGQWSCRRQRS